MADSRRCSDPSGAVAGHDRRRAFAGGARVPGWPGTSDAQSLFRNAKDYPFPIWAVESWFFGFAAGAICYRLCRLGAF